MKIRTVLPAMACVALAACSTTPRMASPSASPSASSPASPSATATVSTTAPPNTTRQMSTYDMATEYTVDYVPDGFTLTVHYRYMGYVLRTGTAETQCSAAVTDVANSLSERRQRPIAAIDARQIRMVTARKWTGGIATCAAVAHVAWRR